MACNVDDENQLLQNALLFNIIKGNKSFEEKIKKINKYIDRGANINAVDANNNHNTPLHVAVIQGDLEIVTHLLARGADPTIRNSKHQTALDIAQQSKTRNGFEIANHFMSHLIGDKVNSMREGYRHLKDHSHHALDSRQSSQQLQQDEAQREDKNKNTPYSYPKMIVSPNLTEHVYATKLSTLILLRTLCDEEITEFYFGSNAKKIDATDNITIFYGIKGKPATKLLFLHVIQEDSTEFEVTVNEVFHPQGNIPLFAYFSTYVELFEDSRFESEFIFFTSAMENFTKKRVVEQSDSKRFLKTNRQGKIFKLEYDQEDVQVFVRFWTIRRALSLAQSLCQLILSDNVCYDVSLLNNWLNEYHVFLAQNVITLKPCPEAANSNSYFWQFRPTFLASNIEHFQYMQWFILKELSKVKNKSNDKPINIETFTFKLPQNFGNINFNLNESQNLIRINDLSSVFQKLLRNGSSDSNAKYMIVNIDNSMVGPNKVLQMKHLEITGLAGLVGNLLILDDETKLLMFDLNLQNLTIENAEILNRLRNCFHDLNRFRFDFHINKFPKLTLFPNEHDKKLVTGFLSRITFYTNQPKEDEIENITKAEIGEVFGIKQTQHESLSRFQCERIFSKVHDQVQKWWQEPSRALCLTKTCNFYEEAVKDSKVDTPVLHFLDEAFRENMIKTNASFEEAVIESLQLSSFVSGDENLLIFSKEIDFTCIKIFQYFEDIKTDKSNLFIDLDFVIMKKYFEDLLPDLNKSKSTVMTLVCNGQSDQQTIIDKINTISKEFNGILIIISNETFEDYLKLVFCENIVLMVDSRHNFTDLAATCRDMILVERKVIFQGEEFVLGDLFNNESQHFIKSDMLRKIINNDKTVLGHPLTNPSYKNVGSFYINQSLCRHVTLDIKNIKSDDFYIILNVKAEYEVPQGTTDIIVITELEEQFKDLCNKYKEINVHWFTSKPPFLLWKKTIGSLKTLQNYVTRNIPNNYTGLIPETLKDINEKTVIINAGQSTGKSLLLTHLAIQTKRMFPKLWITIIDLQELTPLFEKWKVDETDISMKEAILFLYGLISYDCDISRAGEAELLKQIIRLLPIWETVVPLLSIDDEKKINLNMEDINIDSLEINMFNYLYNNNSVALLFDGFDRICPQYADVVLKLLSILKSSRVAHLWVITRPCDFLNQLESVLGTFSYTFDSQLDSSCILN